MSLLLSFLLVHSFLFAQDFAYKTKQQPQIDGQLESIWTGANRFTDFTVFEPIIEAEASVKSEAYFMYDEANIYIAARLYQDGLSSSRFKRDNQSILENDYLQFEFDPFNEGAAGYFITINPHNALADGQIIQSGRYDFKWDGRVETATSRHKDRWEFEIRIPLESLEFQNKESQDWAVSFIRHYAANSESQASHQIIRDDIKRLSSYTKLRNLEDLKRGNDLQLLPYLNTVADRDRLNNRTESSFGKGLDISYKPNSSMNILFTANPDYAQIESDKAVINVSDEPTRFPEKRPFFTANLYRAITAVQTRKVTDINYGLKAYEKIGQFEYDLTLIEDKNKSKWLFNKFILGKQDTYKHRLETGLKRSNGKTFINSVLMNQFYFFDRKLWFTNYLEYSSRDGNHFGDIIFLSYFSREWFFQYKAAFKQVDHNPEEIGFKVFTNRNEHLFRAHRTFRFSESSLQSIKAGIDFSINALLTHSDQSYSSADLFTETKLNLGKAGVWTHFLRYRPETGQTFRHRIDAGRFRDNYSRFDLIEQKSAAFLNRLTSDQSKKLSFIFAYEKKPVRQALSHFIDIQTRYRATDYLALDYSFNTAKIAASAYQEKQSIRLHRFKLDFVLADRIALRAIYSSDLQNFPNLVDSEKLSFGFEEESPSFNLTGSWEFETGSFAYLVFNMYSVDERYGQLNKFRAQDNRSLILKVNKLFLF